MFSWAATCANGNTLKVHSAPQLMVCGSAMLHLVGIVSENMEKNPHTSDNGTEDFSVKPQPEAFLSNNHNSLTLLRSGS